MLFIPRYALVNNILSWRLSLSLSLSPSEVFIHYLSVRRRVYNRWRTRLKFVATNKHCSTLTVSTIYFVIRRSWWWWWWWSSSWRSLAIFCCNRHRPTRSVSWTSRCAFLRCRRWQWSCQTKRPPCDCGHRCQTWCPAWGSSGIGSAGPCGTRAASLDGPAGWNLCTATCRPPTYTVCTQWTASPRRTDTSGRGNVSENKNKSS